MKLLKAFHAIYVMFTEPSCEVHFPNDAIPYWLVSVLMMNKIRQGFKDLEELVWFLTQLVILTRIELLAMAVIIPVIIGKCKTWCLTRDYVIASLTFGLRIAINGLALGQQMRNLSPECIYIVETTVDPESVLRNVPLSFFQHFLGNQQCAWCKKSV